LLRFDFDKQLNQQVRSIPGCLWSKTFGCWHIPDTPGNRKLLGVNGVAVPVNISSKNVREPIFKKDQTISSFNKDELKRYVQMMQLSGYSASTVKTYSTEFGVFLQVLRQHKVTDIDAQRLKDYLQYCHRHLHLSENSQPDECPEVLL
jgi:hypothetical protein